MLEEQGGLVVCAHIENNRVDCCWMWSLTRCPALHVVSNSLAIKKTMTSSIIECVLSDCQLFSTRRAAKIAFAVALYHGISRGGHREDAYFDDLDHER